MAVEEQEEGAAASNFQILERRLEKIRHQPKLENQKHTSVVLSAVEDTLRQQNSQFTPTAYFAALLSTLDQYVSSIAGKTNNSVATAVVYLLDLVAPHVPAPLLRAKFAPILTCLAPALSRTDVDGPFLRSSIGCLVSLLIVQDAQAWALPQSQIGPRKATAALLKLALDQRPKVRKRAQDGLATVLENRPSSPSVDHPAADMCAETALRGFESLAVNSEQVKPQREHGQASQHDPRMIHALQLVKTIASASGGWPSRSLDSLCEVLFAIARSKSEYLTMTAFDVFEAIFKGIANDVTFSKLPRLLEAVAELQPSQNDSQLLPPWLAVISRGYDVSAQMEPEDTFQKLPGVFQKIAEFLASSSYNIRVSASECLVSFLANCVDEKPLLEPSMHDEKVLEKLCSIILSLLDIKFQSAWMEAFTVVGAALDSFRWRSTPLLLKAVSTVGELRTNPSFQNKEQGDQIISKAISAMGPEAVLKILPLNLVNTPPGQQGRAWLLPLMRDSITNTNLSHFKKELIPLSEQLFQKVLDNGNKPKTMEIKIFETLVQQIWACFPGYCDRPLDVIEAFDQEFAELISKVLYQQPYFRATVCKALINLVENLKSISCRKDEEDLIEQGRIHIVDAQESLDHVSTLSSNLLAILFNVYGETSHQHRGPILACIDSFLSITKAKDVGETFDRVATLLDSELKKSIATEAKPQKTKDRANSALPPISHALMDIVVAIAVYLPRESFQSLFKLAAILVSESNEPQLQKKAYKLIPRLAQSEAGKAALRERNVEIRDMMLNSSEKVHTSARRDRLNAISVVVDTISRQDLHFVPYILPEVILRTKETNERAREAAFNLVIQLGEKMQAGGIIDNSKANKSTALDSSSESSHTPASLEEYFTILSTGLAGTTPHMISATVTAISHALYHFKSSLQPSTITDIVSTMDLFLQSPTREVVRSVLGFIKVAVIIIPSESMLPRLETIIPNLVSWSHEHKAHFRAKVKNILERVIRRFGVEVVERYCPDQDRKLVANIRKTRERRKRKKFTNAEAPNGDEETKPVQRQYENELDEAIYGSEDESDTSDSGGSDGENFQLKKESKSGKGGQKSTRSQTYIHEEGDEPLDLLDRKALANISTTRPVRIPQVADGKRRLSAKSKTNADGKLVFGRDDDDDDDDDVDAMDIDDDGKENGKRLEQGINAYVDAINGKDAAQRGRGGRLKFSNRRKSSDGGADEDEEGKDKKPTGKGNIRGNKPRGPPGRGMGKKQRGLRAGHGTGGGRIQKRSFNKR